MKTAVEYLRGALRDLYASRLELDRQIAVIEKTMADLAPSGVRHSDSDSPKPPTVREIAVALAESMPTVTPTEVVEAAHQQGSDAKYESVSSILSRLVREGVLAKGPKRGTYMLPLQLAGARNESPPEVREQVEAPWEASTN